MCFLKDDVFVAWPQLGARVFHFSSATLVVWLVEVGSDPAVLVILLLGAESKCTDRGPDCTGRFLGSVSPTRFA